MAFCLFGSFPTCCFGFLRSSASVCLHSESLVRLPGCASELHRDGGREIVSLKRWVDLELHELENLGSLIYLVRVEGNLGSEWSKILPSSRKQWVHSY